MDSIVKGRLTWLALFVAFAAGFYCVLPVVGPFFLGWGLAYFFQPFVQQLAGRGFCSRGLVSFCLIAFLLLVLTGFLVLFLPFVSEQLQQLLKQLPLYIDILLERFGPYVALWIEKSRMGQWLQGSDTMLTEAARSTVTWVAGSLLAVLSNTQGVFSFFFYLCVTPFVMFHALVEWPALMSVLQGLLPPAVKAKWLLFFSELDSAMAGYIKGQALVCLCMAAYLALGFGLLKLPHGVMLGMLTGLFVFVPYVGMFLGTLIAILLVLVHQPSMVAFVGLVLALIGGQLLEAFLFIPFFVGKRVGMHPVLVLFAIFASGAVLGVWGVLLALPLAIFFHVLFAWGLAFYKETAFFKSARTT